MFKMLNIFKPKSVKTISINELLRREIDNIGTCIKDPIKTNDRYNKLINLGFINSKDVKDLNDSIDFIESNNQKRLNDKEAKDHFNSLYPNHNFITEIAINKAFGCAVKITDISFYNGVVTDEMLNDIEKFDSDNIPDCYGEFYYNRLGLILTGAEYHIRLNYAVRNVLYRKINFMIAFTYIPSDINPIILKPVSYKDRKYYLIVTNI